MILCLDIGNSHIYGGLFSGDKITLTFRTNSQHGTSSDELGIFLKAVLRENNINYEDIEQIAIASVVPSIDYSLRSACLKYLKHDPFFLKAGVKTGLKIKYHNPLEVGADRIAGAIAATSQFPQKNIIIADFGTASVFDVISEKHEYLGGAILPGLRLSMEALTQNTAKLRPVEIMKPSSIIGRSTTESIQSGLYHTHLAATKYFIQNIKEQHFSNTPPVVLGTGGFSHLFTDQDVFTSHVPNLVLYGLKIALEKNT